MNQTAFQYDTYCPLIHHEGEGISVWGVSLQRSPWTEIPLDKTHWTETPLDRDLLDRDPLNRDPKMEHATRQPDRKWHHTTPPPSSGSSGRIRGQAEKHEIYAATFGGHLFYDLFIQVRGGAWPPRPLDPLLPPSP